MEKVRKEKVQPFSRNILGYILLALFALIVIIPLLWVLISSFRTVAGIKNRPFSIFADLTFENYVNAWKLAKFGSYFLNSIITTFVPIAILLILCIPLAYVLSRFNFKFSGVLVFFFLIGLFMNVNYIVVPLHLMIFRMGGFSLTHNLFVISLIKAVTAMSFSFYLLYGYFKTLPKGYEEAAKIDGCGYAGTLFRIVVPLALPSILTVTLFSFMNFWNEYLLTLTFVSGFQQYYTLPLGVTVLRDVPQKPSNVGALYAGLMIIALPVLIVYAFIQKQLTQGLTMGGLKG